MVCRCRDARQRRSRAPRAYGGPPADDESALDEFERLRTRAGFIVVAWPAFWYSTITRGSPAALHASYPVALENDRLIVFDLRAPSRSPYHLFPALVRSHCGRESEPGRLSLLGTANDDKLGLISSFSPGPHFGGWITTPASVAIARGFPSCP